MLIPLELLIASTGLASGLIATYVSLENRALLAEVRKELAEQEQRVTEKLNGKYVRQAECLLREDHLVTRLTQLQESVRELRREASVNPTEPGRSVAMEFGRHPSALQLPE